MLYQLGCTLHVIRLSHLRERWHIYYFLELKGWRGVVSVSGSSLHSWERERFSIAYRGTKTKLITTANISKWYFQKEAARFLSKKKSVGKQQCQSHDWFSFCIWLVTRVTRIFGPITKQNTATPKQYWITLSILIWKLLNKFQTLKLLTSSPTLTKLEKGRRQRTEKEETWLFVERC